MLGIDVKGARHGEGPAAVVPRVRDGVRLDEVVQLPWAHHLDDRARNSARTSRCRHAQDAPLLEPVGQDLGRGFGKGVGRRGPAEPTGEIDAPRGRAYHRQTSQRRVVGKRGHRQAQVVQPGRAILAAICPLRAGSAIGGQEAAQEELVAVAQRQAILDGEAAVRARQDARDFQRRPDRRLDPRSQGSREPGRDGRRVGCGREAGASRLQVHGSTVRAAERMVAVRCGQSFSRLRNGVGESCSKPNDVQNASRSLSMIVAARRRVGASENRDETGGVDGRVRQRLIGHVRREVAEVRGRVAEVAAIEVQ